MPTTTKWALRYPAAADAANVPLDMQELAEDLENNALPLSGTLGARPTPGATRIGLTYYSTDTGVLSIWTGSAWIDIPTGTGSGAQPGDIKATGRSTAPSGWLLCDGASLLRADFAALFTAIGTTYGSVDGTHFNIPDVRGRVPVGVDGAAARLTANDALGQSSGAEKHTLSGSESGTPAHGHGHSLGTDTRTTVPPGGYVFPTAGNWFLATVGLGATVNVPYTTGVWNGGADGSHAHVVTGGITNASEAAASSSHNNMQPFLIVNYAIKT